MRSDFQGYARLVLRTLGARSVAYLGDFSRALESLRHDTVAFLDDLPNTNREAMSRILGIAPRTLDQWRKAAREEEESGEPPNRELMIYEAALSHLEKTGDEFVTLGTIANQVKRTVDRRLRVAEIARRLDTYVSLSILEQDPEDPEAYRLAVRPPSRDTRDPGFVKALLGYVMPAVFDIGYQVHAGVKNAHARISVFDIPDAHQDEFVKAMTEGFLGVSEKLCALERELWERCPDGPRGKYKMVVMAAPNDLETHPFDPVLFESTGGESQQEETS